MSNHLAVAGTTATLVQLLDAAVTRDFSGAHATAGRPDLPGAAEADPEVRVFLYRVAPSAARRNDDLPTRSGDAIVQRPAAALTLDYLLTFIGNEADNEPQRLLGISVGALHFHPVLTRAEIERMVLAAGAGSPLARVDLAEQADLIRITPLALSLDDLANLWSSFFQVEYRLSVAYQAEVVVLTPPESPVRPLPVRERRLVASGIQRPVVRAVIPAAGRDAPILPGSILRIEGQDLRGQEATFVRFGDARVAPTTATGERIEVAVPADVRAGAAGLMVEHQRHMGDPPTLRPAGQSAVVPIVVHPRIQPDGAGHRVAVGPGAVEAPPGLVKGVINVSVDPPVGSRQEVALVLNGLGGGGESFSFLDERRDAPTDPAATNDLAIPFAGVPPGDYLVRIIVSGAESPLEVTTAPGPDQGTYTAPRVSVP